MLPRKKSGGSWRLLFLAALSQCPRTVTPNTQCLPMGYLMSAPTTVTYTVKDPKTLSVQNKTLTYNESASAYCDTFRLGSYYGEIWKDTYSEGTGQNDVDWLWRVDGCIKSGNYRCECAGHDVSSATYQGNAHCICAMDDAIRSRFMETPNKNRYCYLETVSCTTCPAGKFMDGCGCYRPNDWDSTYTPTNDGNPKYKCKTGTCVDAPQGYYVPEKGALRPVECPPYTFQNATGQTACINCLATNLFQNNLCNESSYLPSRTYQACGFCGGSSSGPDYCTDPKLMAKQCRPCDQCTDASSLRGTPFSKCPAFSEFYTKNTAMAPACVLGGTCFDWWNRKRSTGALTQSDFDRIKNRYSNPDIYKSDRWLADSELEAQCVYAYRDPGGTPRAAELDHGVQYVPFRPQYRRNAGEFGRITRDELSKTAVYIPDKLPVYSACSADQVLPEDWLKNIKNSEYPAADLGKLPLANRVYLHAYATWGADCDHGHYFMTCNGASRRDVVRKALPDAVAARHQLASKDIEYLASCPSCGANGEPKPPNYVECRCKKGYAKWTDIQAGFRGSPLETQTCASPGVACRISKEDPSDMESLLGSDVCYDCSKLLLIVAQSQGGDSFATTRLPMVCDGASEPPARLCSSVELVGDGKCIPCPAGQRVLDAQSCAPCDLGYQLNNKTGVCEACPPGWGRWDNAMVACLRKSASCPPGQVANLNNDPTRNNVCQPCGACDSDHPVRVYDSHWDGNASKLCDGSSVALYSCASEDFMASLPVNARAVYTPSGVSSQEFPQSAIGAYASWVEFRGAGSALQKEAYFACSHGYDPAVGKTLRDKLAAKYSKLLGGALLPTRYSGPVRARAFLPTLWSKDTARAPQDWVTLQEVRVTDDAAAAGVRDTYYSQNVWLYDEDIVKAAVTAAKPLCVPPDATAAKSCETAWFQPGAWDRDKTAIPDDTRCALLAVQEGVYKVALPSAAASYYVVLDAASLTPVCVADTLTSWTLACTRTEVRRQLALAQDLLTRSGLPAIANAVRYLAPSPWDTSIFPSFNLVPSPPYAPSVGGRLQCAAAGIPRLVGDGVTPLVRFSKTVTVAAGQTSTAAAVDFCVPCNDEIKANSLCENFLGSIYSFNGAACVTGKPLTHLDVCTSCAALVAGGTLIDPASASRYAEWAAVLTADRRPYNVDAWTCRYECGKGYYRNLADTYEAYKNQPCLPCGASADAAKQQCFAQQQLGATPMFFNKTRFSACALSAGGVALPQSACLPCSQQVVSRNIPASSLQFVLQPLPSFPESLDQCRALCTPASYHTLAPAYTSVEVPQASIVACENCDADLARPCAGRCVADGTYYDVPRQACVACNRTQCPLLGQHRQTCTAADARIADALCVDCDPALLQNPTTFTRSDFRTAAGGNATLLDALWVDYQMAAVAARTRRWIPYDPARYANRSNPDLLSMYGVLRASPSSNDDATADSTGCYLACVNNYVWIDLNTGHHPVFTATTDYNRPVDPSALICIRCDTSQYLQARAARPSTPDAPLHSVWNASALANITAAFAPLSWVSLTGDPVYRMQLMKVKGGCYACADPLHRDTVDGDDRLCALKPGYSDSISSTQVSSVVVALPSSVTTVMTVPTAVNSALDVTTATVYGTVSPVISSEYQYLCCKQMPAPLSGICFRLKTTSSIQNFLAARDAAERASYTCMSSADLSGSAASAYTMRNAPSYRRRLLSEPLLLDGPCLVGWYKEARGDGPCQICPYASSTAMPWNGIAARSACTCLPGHSAVRNDNGTLLRCEPCPAGAFSTYPPNDLETCELCPQNTTSFAESAACFCMPGYYRASPSACLLCPSGHYCADETLHVCPAHSNATAAGSRSQFDCLCDSGFYPAADEAGQYVCLPLPDGAATCDTNKNGSSSPSACTCAGGWTQAAFDPLTGARCAIPDSTCSPGEYIELARNDSLDLAGHRCVRCPRNAYAPAAALKVPYKPHEQQCTPCPLGQVTVADGSASASQCGCPQNFVPVEGGGCAPCPAGNIYNPFSRSCAACPEGLVTPSADMGICLCPAGSELDSSLQRCVPCSIGYYSAQTSAQCQRCPRGRTTLKEGATRCVCPDGSLPRAGICFAA